jgi:hypothetical protein
LQLDVGALSSRPFSCRLAGIGIGVCMAQRLSLYPPRIWGGSIVVGWSVKGRGSEKTIRSVVIDVRENSELKTSSMEREKEKGTRQRLAKIEDLCYRSNHQVRLGADV